MKNKILKSWLDFAKDNGFTDSVGLKALKESEGSYLELYVYRGLIVTKTFTEAIARGFLERTKIPLNKKLIKESIAIYSKDVTLQQSLAIKEGTLEEYILRSEKMRKRKINKKKKYSTL